jgi:hypothetical protein
MRICRTSISDQENIMSYKIFARALSCAFALSFTAPALACSAHVCELPSDWLSQGLAAHPNSTSVSLRYDFAPQTQLRLGTDAVDRSTVSIPNPDEIEQSTYNHALNITATHSFGANWVAEVQVPLLLRPHRTITENETDISSSRTKGLGDVQASLRFQGFGGRGVTGVELGLKLPVGQFHQTFQTGPEAGNPVDRGLQPGSGTTDAILGIYHFGKLTGPIDFLVQAQVQVPLGSREGYQPGVSGALSAGVSYTRLRGITPQLQLNLRAAARDRGANADVAKSGGEQLYVAPGLSARLSGSTILFGIAQLPLYQRVNGYQIAPRYTLSFGVQHKF